MNNIQKRFLLFIFGCVVARLLFVYIAKNIKSKYLPILGYLSLIPAFGFIYIYYNNLRKTGQEVFGDKIWWNDIRHIHSFLYFLFFFMAINRNKNSWIVLLIDVLFGLTMFLKFHYNQNNFTKLF
jgi:membrane protein insertase Oxa1/YidC/SpoIIIJ